MSRLKRKWVSKPRRVTRAALLGICLLAAAAGGTVRAGDPFDQPVVAKGAATSRNAEARRWFEEARYGLFIDWGIDSLLGKGEWVMNNDKLPIREYAKLPPRFNPTRFDAEAWVKLAKESGVKYITITSKHPDGFCMFASRLTDYDIVDATPYHLDPLKALANACHQQGIKLFFSYSLLDWHHPDYFPLGKTGHSAGREPKGDWKRYVAYCQGQVRELCTNYGEIGGIWFDGLWDRPAADWDLANTYRLIHELQPSALVGNNHRVAPKAGEDLQGSGPDLPVASGPRSNQGGIAVNLPRETWLTINDSSGYNPHAANVKSAEQIIHALVGAAGQGANLRLTVGAGPDGTIGPEVSQRLLEVGKWLETHGDSIYKTHQGPFPPQPWGVWTARGPRDHPEKIYLHILKPNDHAPIVFDRSIAWRPFLHGKTTPLKLTETQGGLVLDVPKDALAPIDTIIVLTPK
jgi:alpha-L-fucosidase